MASGLKTQSCKQMALRGREGRETEAQGSCWLSQGPSYRAALSHLSVVPGGHMKGPGGTAFSQS